MRILFGAALLCTALWGHSADASVINGDFSNGYDGWDLSVEDPGGNVVDQTAQRFGTGSDGSDPYAELNTGFFPSGPNIGILSQDVFIDPLATTLTFDIGLLPSDDDPLSTGNDTSDVFVLSLGDSNLVYGRNDVNQLSFSTITSLTPLPGSIFDTQVSVDLSGFVGTTVNLQFRTASFDDGQRLNFALDNVQLLGDQMTPVPLPMPFMLLGSGLGMMFLIRRRKTV